MEERPHELSFVPDKVETDPVAEALETLAYGLYIIGSRGSDNLNGMMADWVMQVSFQPRLLACSLEKDSTTLRNLRETRAFSVNLLAEADVELARRFAQPRVAAKIVGRSEADGNVIHDKLRGVEHSPGPETGSPILQEALAYIECRVTDFLETGDHVMAIGEVVGAAVLRDGEPLSSRDLGWSYAG